MTRARCAARFRSTICRPSACGARSRSFCSRTVRRLVLRSRWTSAPSTSCFQGFAPATAFLDRLNVQSFDGYDVRRQVLGMTAQHLKPGSWYKVRDEVGDGAFRRLAQKVDLELLARVAKADCEGRKPGAFDCSAMDWFLERARSLGVEHRPPAPILLGRHVLELGLEPGPRVGEILKAVYEQQLDGRITTLEEAIDAAKLLVEVPRD